MLSQYYCKLFRLSFIEMFGEYIFMPKEIDGIDFICGSVHFTQHQLANFVECDYIPKYADFLLELNQ